MAALVSCDTDAQFAPSLDRVVGLHVDGPALWVVPGAPCADVTELAVLFSQGSDKQIPRTIWVAASPRSVDELSVGAQVSIDGFDATELLPFDFDWRDYSEMSVIMDGPDGSVGVATSDLDPVTSEGAQHEGDGTAYIRGEGWLTPQEIAAGDTKSFLAACTPDPDA